MNVMYFTIISLKVVIIMNRRGMTLVELLVAVLLVGTVLTLLLSVINNIKRDEINVNNDFDISLNKLKFVREVQNDLKNNKLLKVDNGSSNGLELKFTFEEGETFVNVSDDKIEYVTFDGTKTSWQFKNISKCGHIVYYKDNHNAYLKINIYLNNNKNSSLEISYIGSSLNMGNEKIDKDIGTCTN